MMHEKTCDKPHIDMRLKYGWKLYQEKNMNFWFCGYQYNDEIKNILSNLSTILKKSSVQDVLSWVKEISGNFSVVVETNEWTIAVVDKICTIPIFTFMKKGEILISNHTSFFKNISNLENVNFLARLEISMSGYTNNSKSLYCGLSRLEGGECAIYHKGIFLREYYYTYSPWKTKVRSEKHLKKEFTDVCINTLKQMKNSINGRQIVIPLSAGNDSRLIASGLKNLGVENVICFSYGRKGNFETEASKNIAKKLGYKWLYFPITIKGKRDFFKSDVYRKYVKDFESYSSIPNIQEIYEVSLLKNNILIDDDAVIVNGNSGDFISGGHVKAVLNKKYKPKNLDELNYKSFLDKHYSLWGDLRGPINDSYIVSELKKNLSLRVEKLPDLGKYHYAIMECLECIGRQSKIVTNQQRAYDYFGYDWRLPLWSDEMLNFWESVPYEYKISQNLYINTLHENNWGSVWLDIKVNNKVIRPFVLRWLRILFKVLFIPIGKSKWHKFEKNVFEYFMHPAYVLTAVSYFRVLFDCRGYRNVGSWLSHDFLKKLDR
jgi:asparagine synthase (glutamine-hydrolysing)